MTIRTDNPYNALTRVFHEPSRLSIVSALCSAAGGVTFAELREECDLTDGNLSRHLKMLEEHEIIVVHKAFVDSRPRTTVCLTDEGRDRFVEYLSALEEVLKLAGEALEIPLPRPIDILKAARI